jgi:hypothetical protein
MSQEKFQTIEEEHEPTLEQRKQAMDLLLELNEIAKKPWFKAIIEGIVFGPNRLLERGVDAAFRKLNSKQDRSE